jgi:hypothetical protein
MATFPGSPLVQKGAIVGVDPLNPLASIIVFQYNPDSMTRRLQVQAAGDGGNPHEALRLKGPPQETISLEIEIDATDQLETASFPATKLGLYPVLSSLEMLLYPKAAREIANEVLASAGLIEVVPPEAPLTLLVWGIKRVVPVRLTELSITEEAFDPALNPIRAKASVSVQVLTYQDLGLASAGGALFLAYQLAKEAMATMNGVGSISGGASVAAGMGPF